MWACVIGTLLTLLAAFSLYLGLDLSGNLAAAQDDKPLEGIELIVRGTAAFTGHVFLYVAGFLAIVGLPLAVYGWDKVLAERRKRRGR